jgi:poly-beta-1,6-N-acetyl-D-glucosamine synthase
MSNLLDKRTNYVIVTAAHNEEAFIPRTIESVLKQTVLPVQWMIVSDGSWDGTDEVVRRYASRCDFIHLLHVEGCESRGTRSKVNALKAAVLRLGDLDYDFIANLDADITLVPTYFETLLRRFRADPLLGIVGGVIHEMRGSGFKCRRSNNTRSVAHAAQLVRKRCFEELGGYTSVEYGGEDWYAEIKARMLGWHVYSIPQLAAFHHRRTGGTSTLIQHCFRQGLMDYSFGSHPVFELLKCFRRLSETPMLLGSALRFAGFAYSHIRKYPVLIPVEMRCFLRREQKERLNVQLSRLRSILRARTSKLCY